MRNALVNRAEAKQFAEDWVVDARALLDAGRWHAAYYLVGYAVECALKACVLSYIDNTGIIFQDKKFAEKCFTHDIEVLVKTANLEVVRGLDNQANPALENNWQIVKDWNVDIRYLQRTEVEARKLYDAVTDNANGMLPWIKDRW
jgi:HEPN domain-containing protein